MKTRLWSLALGILIGFLLGAGVTYAAILYSYEAELPAYVAVCGANFVGSPTSGAAPCTVQFTDKSIGDVNSWSWDFGDGGVSTEQNPVHTYSPGIYTVTLTITESAGMTDSEIKTNYISVSAENGAPVIGSKTEKTSPGHCIVNAKDEAASEVEKEGNGTPTITIAKYGGNPGSGFSGDIGSYIDVHIDSSDNVSCITIKLYYSQAEIDALGIKESTLRMRWWNGESWIYCSDKGVDTLNNYIWANVTDISTPNLDQLIGTSFSASGESYPAPAVGGQVYPINKLRILALWIGLATLLVGSVSWFTLRRRKALKNLVGKGGSF